MTGKTQVAAIAALMAISLVLSGVIVAATDDRGWGRRQVFEAENAPEAVRALLAAAGLPTEARSDDLAPVLSPGAALAIAGTKDASFTLKGVGFKPAMTLKSVGGAKQWKAKTSPLKPDARKGTAKGSLFPGTKVSGITKDGLAAVQKDALGRTKFKRLDTEAADTDQIASPAFKKVKPNAPPFNKSFALAGKINKKNGKAIGKFTTPALEYRQWADRIKAKKEAGRTGKVKKTLAGSFTKLDDAIPPEKMYLADTKLGTFTLKTTMRRGVPTDFRIAKKPASR